MPSLCIIFCLFFAGLAMNDVVVRARGQHVEHDGNVSTLESQDRQGMDLCFQTADAGGRSSLDAQAGLVRMLAPKRMWNQLGNCLMIEIDATCKNYLARDYPLVGRGNRVFKDSTAISGVCGTRILPLPNTTKVAEHCQDTLLLEL
jgi:hypothetical protein